jgi:hypothetical protein
VSLLPSLLTGHAPHRVGRRGHARSNALRPEGWTSADAAGLPIYPLLARYGEVHAGRIDRALRVTVPRTQAGYIHPATHFASDGTDPDLPPMGLRLRLNAHYDLAPFHGQALVILRALKRYGLIVADTAPAGTSPAPPTPVGTKSTSTSWGKFPGPRSKPSAVGRSGAAEPRLLKRCRWAAPAESRPLSRACRVEAAEPRLPSRGR